MRGISLLIVVALSACPKPKPEQDFGARLTVSGFTEPNAVTALAVLPPYLVVGTTTGLERWDVRSGSRVDLRLTANVPQGAAALAVDAKNGRVWMAAGESIAAYDLAANTGLPVPKPLAAQATALRGVRALANDARVGGVWVGSSTGLYHADMDGVWAPGGISQPVSAIYQQRDGTVWAGIENALIRRTADGTLTRFGKDEGLEIGVVVAAGETPNGKVIAVGEGDGQSRVAFFDGKRFATFTFAPSLEVVGLGAGKDMTVIVTSERLLALSIPGAIATKPTDVRLIPVGRGGNVPYRVDAIDAETPGEMTSVAASGGQVYIGTRTLGAAFITAGGGLRWFRNSELVDGAEDLYVGCVSPDECYVATSSQKVWKYGGGRFAPIQVAKQAGTVTLAVVVSNEGEVLALYRERAERRLHVARLDAAGFKELAEINVETPGGVSALSFCKFSPDGMLWLGLQYRDEEGDLRPFGAATVDISLGTVTYHHETGEDKRSEGIFPVPNDVTEVAFLDQEVWFASQSGAARMRPDAETGDVTLEIYTEAEGLLSELLHGVVVSEGGLVFVASTRGVGVYDGLGWKFPTELALTVRALVLNKVGHLWMATDKGVVVFDGQSTVRIDRRAGLLDDDIQDIVIDRFERIWVRSKQGFSLINEVRADVKP